MTSEDKTRAYLARRVSALEKKLAFLTDVVDTVVTNQQYFKPVVDGIHEGIKENREDHERILKHLGIDT